MNPITYRKQIQLLFVRFAVAVVLKIVIEQTLYETVGRQVLLNLVIRRLFHRFVFQRILCPIVVIKVPGWFAQIILLFIFITSRITIIGGKELERIKKEKQRVIFAFWHGDYTLLLFSFRIKKAVALVHSSFRGDFMAQLASVFKYRIVRISRRRRSIMPFMEAIKEGYSGFIAVDGPLGPARETKAGAIYIARKSRAKIIPLAVQARRGFLLNRWDNHCLPLPFNNITISIGKPIVVKEGDSLELKRGEVTSSLLELTQIN
ncbi:hypothetical protein LCGC14_1552500 [marine sediment metagenome]|uniref:DUF374 domain-containing protein n=1 Tax=marine sediment metagenome TaxID=412755 RepID=A0A0F9IPZ0_9ZZZZ